MTIVIGKQYWSYYVALSIFHYLNNIFMSVIKVIEVMANSPKSWEDAAQIAVKEASKTLDNVKSVYIKDHCAIVEKGKIIEYRITCKISFELNGHNKGKN